jgi:thymidylate synthase (FAD)
MSDVKLIWITPEAEKHIMYCARVSNPKNQQSEDTGLLKYCVRHGHWSVFEMASMCLEVTTKRSISAQMIRHRSYCFQEFSQRYAEALTITKSRPRRQDTKNRQNSLDDLSDDVIDWWDETQEEVYGICMRKYKEALEKGIAKECARDLLPMATETKLYMSGTIRSWIHYLQLRCDEATQLEHREIADKAKEILIEQLPTIGEMI